MDRQELNFLKKVDGDRNKFYYARITVLDKYERPIKTIQGRVQQGSSISINGSSNIRRTCNLTLIADKIENDLTDVENLLSINKKIKVAVGVEKNIDYNEDLIYYESAADGSHLPPFAKGQKGKIYVDRLNLKSYIWNGADFIQIKDIYDYQKDIIWFPMGVYVIMQPSLNHGTNGCIITLNCQDKMCLLNGSMGGNLPAPIIFGEYDQEIGNVIVSDNIAPINPNEPPVEDPTTYNIYHYRNKSYMWTRKYGWRVVDPANIKSPVQIKTTMRDIIETCVINYGGESQDNVIINDLETEIKQTVRYTGSKPLYHNLDTGLFTLDEHYLTEGGSWVTYGYNDEVGYVYTDFVYPSDKNLSSSIGDNVCTILDKIKNALGNYEYFYDIEGHFVFQEIKNYLNNSYNPLKRERNVAQYYIDENKSQDIEIENNFLKILGEENYFADYFGDQKSVYTFEEGNNLVTSYSNNPNFTQIKNDYHIWGKTSDNKVIHYHLAIKDTPKQEEYDPETQKYKFPTRSIVFKKDDKGKFTGQIRWLKKEDFQGTYATNTNTSVTFIDPTVITTSIGPDGRTQLNIASDKNVEKALFMTPEQSKMNIIVGADVVSYTPTDWRAELYLQGLEIAATGGRPDIYQQELLDFFDSIYEWGYYDYNPVTREYDDWKYEGRFKVDIVMKPNALNYFLDYLAPVDGMDKISVDEIKPKIYSYHQDNIVKLYNEDVPNYIFIDEQMSNDYKEELREKCASMGQPTNLVDATLYSKLAEGIVGYTAEETARSFLYQYTNYNETISIQAMPVYYLDVNQRITVRDKQSGINGDYIINSITLPLSPQGSMNINASKALNRI